MISVADTGEGMEEATRQRLFEPFFTTREIGRGTGLGLATVYSIVKQSEGYIWSENGPLGGSVFRVCFPHVSALSMTEEADSSAQFSEQAVHAETADDMHPRGTRRGLAAGI
ncbi:MAG: HAMP domain-containing sensor histidine kinase [Acidobacteriota bacterium]|nr:HAMP domain-containing sensor histidine kinase [Acidobacteriota bacterium]